MTTPQHRQPAGTHSGGRFAAAAHAEAAVALDPMLTLSAGEVRPGHVVIVDGEERTVDAVTPSGDRVYLDFASPDLEPDGTPSAFLIRDFPSDEPMLVVATP